MRPTRRRLDQALDRDGFADAGAPDVGSANEPGEERDDADPAAHGRRIAVVAERAVPGSKRGLARHTAGGTMHCREASVRITTRHLNR
jgi:hypothetical protein